MTENIKQKISYYFNLSILSLSFVIIFYFFYLVLYPFELIRFYDLRVIEPIVKQGEMFHYTITIDKNTDVIPDIKYYLINNISYRVNYDPNYISKGKNKEATFYLKMPTHLPEGEYALEIVTTYQHNLFRKETYSWKSNKFKVIAEQ